jgi:PKD repeat protein
MRSAFTSAILSLPSRRLRAFALALLAAAFAALPAFAGPVTFRWDYTTSGAAGFVLYCGAASRNYPTRIDVGNTDTHTISTLKEGTTSYCAVTAYDSNRKESAYSNEATVSVPYTTPAASFSASPTSGTAPLNVQFTDTSTGQITAWAWSFGDGTTSTAQNPSHSYAAAGSYSVTLTATASNGTKVSATRSSYIAVSSTATAATYSLWPSTAIPATPSDPDGSAVNLGVKFSATQNGYVTGIRFYKSSTNLGTHVGTLWSASGQKLAQVTFSNETASGWQQAKFSSPVAITANTVYIASYFAPRGHYAGDNGYFSTKGVTNGPLRALQNGVSGPNGLYAYGSGPLFPTSSYQATNYWVDVLFAPAQ